MVGGGREMIFMCASCGFEKGDRISSSGLGRAPTPCYFPEKYNLRKPDVIKEQPGHFMKRVSWNVLLQTPSTVLLSTDGYLVVVHSLAPTSFCVPFHAQITLVTRTKYKRANQIFFYDEETNSVT